MHDTCMSSCVWCLSYQQQIKACAKNGKHVFCEKPIATDVPETIEAINACNNANVKLMTALQRRFDPNFARVKVAISDGEVGDVIQVLCGLPCECVGVCVYGIASRPVVFFRFGVCTGCWLYCWWCVGVVRSTACASRSVLGAIPPTIPIKYVTV